MTDVQASRSESAAATSGIFDRSSAGHEFPPVEVPVDERAIRLFAETLGMTPPASGEIAAPPTFFTFLDAEADRLRTQRGEPTILEILRADYRFLLHGEESYEYFGAILPGDRVTIRTRIAEFYDKASGALEFARVEQSAEDAKRGFLLRASRLYIHKLPG